MAKKLRRKIRIKRTITAKKPRRKVLFKRSRKKLRTRTRPRPVIKKLRRIRKAVTKKVISKAKKVTPQKISVRALRNGLARNAAPRYMLDNSFEFLYELRDLILKSSPAEKNSIVEKVNKLGRIKLAIIAGIFMNKENPDPTIADLLIVGNDIDNRRLKNFLKALEAEVGKEIKFTVMEREEFQYRLSMFDRFIRVLLESPHEKLINRLGL